MHSSKPMRAQDLALSKLSDLLFLNFSPLVNNLGGCSIVGKPLCYHVSNPGSILGGHATRSPYLLTLLGQLSLPSFQGW